jgi:hypothetical protein
VVSGILVTESGILAAIFGGAGSVKAILQNNGEKYIKGCVRDFNTVTWKHLEDMILV